VSDFDEMAKKTGVRNAFKMWPRSSGSESLAEAVHLSNENEGFEKIINNPEIRDFTAQQKEDYDKLIQDSDELGMYIFCSTLEEGVKINLYHSFEKGSKGKFQQIVDNLEKNGHAIFTDYLNSINESGEDDLAILGFAEELSKDTLALMADRFTPEAKSIISENDLF